jgi:hypothetical protein
VAGLALLAPAAAHAQTPASFVFQPGPSSAFGTSLKTDANGDAWLATYRSGVPGKVVISVRRADGTVRLVHTYTAPAGYSVLAPKITVRNGLATVAWSQYKGSSGIRAMAIRCKASGCGRAQEVGRGQRVKTEATPAVDQSGRSFVFWRGTSSKGPRLQWAVTTNGRFGKVHTLGQFGSGLAAIADPRGGELLAWTAPDGRVAVGRRSSGEVSTPQHLSSGPATDVQLVAAGPEVAAAWHDGRGDGEGQPGAGAVQAAIRGAGHYDFDPAQTVFAGNGRDIELAANASGRVAIAFADASANPDAVFLVTDYVSVRTGPGAAFGTPVRAGTGPLYTPPAVAVEPGGRVVAAWTQQADLQNQMHVDAAALRPQLDAFLPATDLGQGNAPLAASIAGGTVVAFSGPAAYQGALLSSAS